MPQQPEPRLLTGGINADASPDRAGKDAVLNCLNMHSGLPDAPVATIPGNSPCTAINDILPAGTSSLLGFCVYDTIAYLLFYNGGGCFILTYDKATNTAFTLITDSLVTDGLGWNANMYISCSATKDLLIFTEPTHEVRYLKTGTAYSSVISQSELSLITEPPVAPLRFGRIDTPGVNSTIQFTSLQFTWRFTNSEGFTSVLAPYSLTSFATREVDILDSATAGNTITVYADYEQTIPSNWKYVEFVVRFPDTGIFYIINRWSVSNAADRAAVAAHNAQTTPLTLSAWSGVLQETLPSAYTAKPSDNVPNSAAAVALAGNRAMLGNITEGYDTPDTDITLSLTNYPFNISAPTFTATQTWIVFVKQYNVNKMYFAVVLREGSDNFLLPKECSIGYFESGNLPNPTLGDYNQVLPLGAPVFALPEHMHRSSLIKLKESGDFRNLPYNGPAALSSNPAGSRTVRESIVVEANALVGFESEYSHSSTFDHWMVPYTTIKLDDDAPDAGIGGAIRAFVPNAFYNIGIDFYDAALRKCGSRQLATYTAPAESSFSGGLSEKVLISPSMGVGASLPGWAKYFSILFSRNQRTERLIQFLPGLVKTAVVENEVTVFRGRDAYISTPTSALRGIAFPIASLATANYGYEYTAGDLLEYEYTDGSSVLQTGTLIIREAYAGHIITYDDSSQHSVILDMIDDWLKNFNLVWTAATYDTTMAIANADDHLQKKLKVTILSKNQSDLNLYEVAAFGSVVESGGQNVLGNFFDGGSPDLLIYGDTHLQTRISEIGSATVISSTANERNALFWTTDAGRIAPRDPIGQASLPDAIRWSNTHIPGAATNGYASFDVEDIKSVDETAGPIRVMLPTTRGIQDGAQLLVLCERNSFVGLVDQQQITGASGEVITITGQVLSSFNPVTGGYGCRDPRSAQSHEGSAWWWDDYHSTAVEFNASGAQAISRHNMASVFSQMSGAVTACVNPYNQEVLFSFSPISDPRVLLPTTNLYSPDFALFPEGYTYAYKWVDNKWTMAVASGAQMFNIQNAVFGYKNGRFWKELAGGTTMYDTEIKSMLVIPFNEGYPATVTPGAVELDCDVQPSEAWVIGRDGDRPQVAQVNAWKRREGTWQGMVRRNRNRPGSDAFTWPRIGINGDSVKTRCPIMILIWTEPVTIRSATLNTQISSGHLK